MTLSHNLRHTPSTQIKFSSMEEISLFKAAFYYLFSNSFKVKTFFTSFCSRPESRVLLEQIVNYCKVQNYLTSISFKTLVNFLSSFSQYHCDEFFNEASLLSILHLTLANFENPTPGIKENNLIIFRLFLSLKKDRLPTLDFSKIIYTDLSWKMKAKYLMMMEILDLDMGSIQTIPTEYPDLIPKLLDSMKINYLVSACTELYLFIIGCINFEQWKKMFFEQLIIVLSSDSYNDSQKWNILNHWTVKTLKVFPPSIEYLLSTLHEKRITDESSNTLLAILMCLKTLRKQGMNGYKEFDDFSKWEPVMLEGLQHIDERIRSECFNLLCSCTKTTIEPSKTEYTLVLHFLINNISYDSSYLRQNLLTAFVIFLDRLKQSVMCKLPANASVSAGQAVWFFKTLTDFLTQNLAVGSNYQRQITSLKLLKIVLEYCNKFDASNSIKFLVLNDTLQRCLHQRILEGTDDVVETAAQIVVLFISTDATLSKSYWSKNALSEFNHDPLRFCAHNEVLLKVCALTESANSESSSSLERVVQLLVQSIFDEEKILSQDALQVASTGTLYCSLKALARLTSDRETTKLHRFSKESCSEILTVVEKIVQQLLISLTAEPTDELEVAPSFAEMGMAIDKQIQKSILIDASKKKENEDRILLSSAHQSLLCSIWRNLQACCDLSVNLVMAYNQDLPEEEVLRSGRLVSTVLLQCRHKGAIEAAGISIGRFIRFIVKEAKNRYFSWIDELLAKVFLLMTSESSKTISRRSAGLSILIHRLALNDTRPYQNVLGKIVPVLLDIAEKPFTERDLVLKDVPQAQAMHLLCKIVEDSSLRMSVAIFLERIVQLLCSSFSSPVWGIRNAALQLSGAVILKVLGRNKTQETECLINTTFDQLFSHHEYLMEILLESFTNLAEGDSDKIIFLLTILSYTSIQMDDESTRPVNQQNFLVKLKELVYQFIRHKNYEVRRLAAVSYVNLFPVSRFVFVAQEAVFVILSTLGLDPKKLLVPVFGNSTLSPLCVPNIVKKMSKSHDENLLHGCLLIIKFAVLKFKKESKIRNEFHFFSPIYKVACLDSSELCSFLDLLSISSPSKVALSFPVKTLIYEICYLTEFTCGPKKSEEFLESEIRALTKLIHTYNPHEPKNIGINTLLEAMLKCLVARQNSRHMGSIFWFCSLNYGYNLLNVFLKEMKLDEISAPDIFSRCFQFLSVGFFAEDAESRVINLTVIEFMISILDAFKISLVGKVESSLDNIKTFWSSFEAEPEFLPKAIVIASSMLYLCCNIDCNAVSKEIVSSILAHIPELITSNFEETRLSIAKSLFYLTKLVPPGDEAICLIWESIVYLLQDEEYSIRSVVSEVVMSIGNEVFLSNPFVSLSKIIEPNTMLTFMEPDLVFRCYCARFMEGETSIVFKRSSTNNGSDVVCNPFNYTHYNFYLEESVVLRAIFKNFCIFLRDSISFKLCNEVLILIENLQLTVPKNFVLPSLEFGSNYKKVFNEFFKEEASETVSELYLEDSFSLKLPSLKTLLRLLLVRCYALSFKDSFKSR